MTTRAAPPLATAGAAFIDQYTVRRDVTYLIRNGIEPNDAVQRVVAHRRRMVIWGLVVAAAAPWSGGFIGGGIYLALMALDGQNPAAIVVTPFLVAIGVGMVYLALMYHLHSWRTAARGVPWEDGLRYWSPTHRRAPMDLDPEPFDALRGLLAWIVCLALLALWAAPILGGTMSALLLINGTLE